MYHIVYLTTNLVNQKIYVGVHSTYDLSDGYLGSGQNIKRAIKKYNRVSFKRDILYYCLSHEDAYNIEQRIVTKEFIKRGDTYNLTLGGIYPSRLGLTYNEIYGDDKAKELKQSFGSPKEKHPLWGRGHTQESRVRISNNHSDVTLERNGRARKWKVIDPCGKEYICHGTFIQFCLDNNINSDTLKKFNGKPVTTTRKNNSAGWCAIPLFP